MGDYFRQRNVCVCGILAITLPVTFSVGLAILLGWLILVAGIAHVIFAFHSHRLGFVWQVLLAGLYGIAAINLFVNPLFGHCASDIGSRDFSRRGGSCRNRSLPWHPSVPTLRLDLGRRNCYLDSRDRNLQSVAADFFGRDRHLGGRQLDLEWYLQVMLSLAIRDLRSPGV